MISATLNVNNVLAMVNGAMIIVVASLIVCLVAYVRLLCSTFKITTRELIRGPIPLGIKLALPMITIKMGAMMALLMAWSWRLFGDGPMPDIMIVVLMTGVSILIDGGLWLIRVLTHYRYGEWPWLTTAALVIVYVFGSILWYSV